MKLNSSWSLNNCLSVKLKQGTRVWLLQCINDLLSDVNRCVCVWGGGMINNNKNQQLMSDFSIKDKYGLKSRNFETIGDYLPWFLSVTVINVFWDGVVVKQI